MKNKLKKLKPKILRLFKRKRRKPPTLSDCFFNEDTTILNDPNKVFDPTPAKVEPNDQGTKPLFTISIKRFNKKTKNHVEHEFTDITSYKVSNYSNLISMDFEDKSSVVMTFEMLSVEEMK